MPLARTYSIRVSILTGEHPVNTNARFNLMPRALVNEGDLPLVNVLSAMRIGGWLFPSNRANRAAYVTYEPAHFLSRLD